MKRALIFASIAALAAQAHGAGPQRGPSFSTSQSENHAQRSVSFRLVEDRDFDPYRVHNSGIVAQTDIGPNASIGLGLLKAKPKKPVSGDWILDNSARRSRKAAVSLRLKF